MPLRTPIHQPPGPSNHPPYLVVLPLTIRDSFKRTGEIYEAGKIFGERIGVPDGTEKHFLFAKQDLM